MGENAVSPPDLQNVDKGRPRRNLSLFDSVCIIVGTIIGSGIFKAAPGIASRAGDLSWLVVFWLAGGLLSLIGALCFAELTTTHREEIGGDYIYLKRAYGRPLAFMFAWASFWIIRPGNIAAMAMVFATYFDQLVPFASLVRFLDVGIPLDLAAIVPVGSQVPYALLSVIGLSGANLIGIRSGKSAQNLLTTGKVIGIGLVVLVAFAIASPGPATSVAAERPSIGAAWLAMVLVMFTFGGWNDLALVAGEVRRPETNLLRALIFGTVIVTAVYVLVNLAFVQVLGYEAMKNSEAVATDTLLAAFGADTWLGRSSGALISALVCISCLGAINGMVLTGPRIYYAVGRDYGKLSFLARWSRARDVPWQATLLQAVITSVIILLCLPYPNAFEVIVAVVAPYFWTFLGLSAISLIVFRLQGSKVPGFRVPLFPFEPLVLTAVCGALTWASISWVVQNQFWEASLTVAGLMVVGIILGVIANLAGKRPPAEGS